MKLAIIYSRAAVGLQAPQVCVEAHISKGLPCLSIVGLPETAVRESKERVRSAIINSIFEFPNRRITINLAPADLPKEGGRFDLPIALGILAASGQLDLSNLANYEFAGELALSGQLRPFKSVLPFAIATNKSKRELIIPIANANEASMLQNNIVFGAKSLTEVCDHLSKKNKLNPYSFNNKLAIKNEADLSDIKGQPFAKRALEIAAAGKHSMLMVGPPGTGKTMLASRISSILPTMQLEESLETAAIHSLSNTSLNYNFGTRPFRNPHHTSSSIAIVGGGTIPQPGEISLAHNGILFLDELPEFDRKVLEVLREPLEAKKVIISRAKHKAMFPANFQLITAMNPCPCGNLGNKFKSCCCSSEQIYRYNNKISGPMLDRIDMQIEVPAVKTEILTSVNLEEKAETSAIVRARVEQASLLQFKRFGNYNSSLDNKQVAEICKLDHKCRKLIQNAMENLNLSARSYYRILKVARTIADLELADNILEHHLSEALCFRDVVNRFQTATI